LNLNAPPEHPLVSASILSADFTDLAGACRLATGAGAHMVHLDVMDGHFVDNLTMGPDLCRCLRQRFPELFLDVHLMVERPDRFIEPFVEAGANLVSFHSEVCRPLRAGGLEAEALIASIRRAGAAAGMAINPGTGAEALSPWIDALDVALVMSVEPGRAGQAFMPGVLSKAHELHARRPTTCRIEMDGGIKRHNAALVRESGVDLIVAASAIFAAPDPEATIAILRGLEEAPR